MTRYLARKSLLYLLTFFVAVTIDWAIPRLMPGDPIDGLISRLQADSRRPRSCTATSPSRSGSTSRSGGSTANFWRGLAHGDLGPSIAYVGSSVSELIWAALPYTLALLIPAIISSYVAGNRVGAMAARRKVLDNTVLPFAYILAAEAVRLARARARLLPRVQVGIFPRLRSVRLLAPARVDLGVRVELHPALVPPVPHPVPRLVRRVGDRDAET